MINPIVSINIVVLNGEKYIEHCLNSVLNQSFSHEQIQINILDNGSTDNTRLLIQDFEFRISNYNFPKVNFIMSNFNHGMWGGQEELSKQSQGKYIVVLSVDVILEKDFILHAVRVMDNNPKLGALQPKVYQFNISDLSSHSHALSPKIIDTCGFKMFRSRRIVNI
ncbi:MAG: glycosyltransferase, partial [Patescibacteria group bacterium]